MSSPNTSNIDQVNRAEWSKDRVVVQYRSAGSAVRLDSWSDPGEQVALSAIASGVRGRAILDVGVGGGRTTRLLRLLSDDYVGIDYTQEMVDACKLNFPDADIRLADARDLSQFEDESFALAVFSYNGLDAIDHLDRATVLDELSRVLEPGGLLLYSTHNKDGPCFRATAMRPAGSPVAHTWNRSYRIGFSALGVLSAPLRLPRAMRNRRRLLRSALDCGSWAIGPNEAHDFGLLVHYVTRRGILDELAEAGLELAALLDAEHGRAVHTTEHARAVRYFQVIARKPSV